MDLPDQISSPNQEYTVGKKLFEGDVADLYETKYVKRFVSYERLLKVARTRRDNDLLENEASVLRVLYPPRAKDEKFYRYLPKLADSFLHESRRVNVLPYFDEYVSLEQIIQAYPQGVHFRDMVWMFKRLLASIGFAHTQGVIHGAVLPSHVLVHPTEHGSKLIGWSYAVNFAPTPKTPDPDPVVDPKGSPAVPRSAWDRIHDLNLYDDDEDDVSSLVLTAKKKDSSKKYVRAISVAYDKFYPMEVFKKHPPTPATDIFMAGKCMIALLGGDVETNVLPSTVPDDVRSHLQAFLSSCVLGHPRKRLQDAWDVHEAFDDLLRRLVGPPRYRPFAMPA